MLQCDVQLLMILRSLNKMKTGVQQTWCVNKFVMIWITKLLCVWNHNYHNQLKEKYFRQDKAVTWLKMV